MRKTLTDIGFTSSDVGFDGHTCGVNVAIGEQSQEMVLAVDTSTEARDRGDDFDEENDSAGATIKA